MNYLKILLIALTLLFSVITLTAEVRFGERPFIDIYKVPDSAIQPGHIRIKLNEKYSGQTAAMLGSDGLVMSFGIEDLDAKNVEFGVSKIIPVFGDPSKNIKYVWRHIQWGLNLWFDLEFDSMRDIRDIVMDYRSLTETVQWAEPEYVKTLLSFNQDELAGSLDNLSRWTPNDPRFGEQWHYHNTGQRGGTVDADIDLPEAWEIEKGHPDVIVQVNDGGIQTNHPDLSGNLWINTGEIAGNGIDDDNNGFIDDIYGYNFVIGVGDIYPHSHGTHVAGTIAARSNNSTGVTGIAGGSGTTPGVKLMSTQVYTTFDSGGWENAITYAADNGAAISQNSWGWEIPGAYEQAILDAIDYFNTNGGGAVMNGGITICAASNENSSGQYYPGCYSGCFAVTASNQDDMKASYSNYDTWVDVSAPGGETGNTALEGILSTDIEGEYSFKEGTSMACPHVSGVAALVLSYAHRHGITLTNTELANIIRNTTDNHYGVNSTYLGMLGTGRINAYSALMAADPTRPICTITSPNGGQIFATNSSITVNVNATDSGGYVSSVAFYLDGVLKSTDTIAPYSWLWDSSGEIRGNHIIKVIATNNAGHTADRSVMVTLLAPADEGFEAGHFAIYPWVNNSLIPWTIQTAELYTGSYAAKSGAPGASSSSILSLPLEISSSGSISFYYKVSSESNYDYLRFYIDDVQMGEWSGERGWSAASYPVSSGSHNFKWTYMKNSQGNSGSDCAWLDHIVFPPLVTYFAPPQNLLAVAGNGLVNLTWEAPAVGTPTAYSIYRDDAPLTTVIGLNHSDTSVVNNNTYSYYVRAQYAGGQSDPSQTVTAFPTNMFSTVIMIGEGTQSQQYPIYRGNTYSNHEAIYLASQIGTPCTIKSIGYEKRSGTDLTTIGAVSIYLKHTEASTLANGDYSTEGYTLVYSGTFPNTATSGWMEVELDTLFEYNGSSNLALLLTKGSQEALAFYYPLWSYSTTASPQARQYNNHRSQPVLLYASNNLPNLKLQAYVAEGILYPALNLSAAAGDGFVSLSWEAPFTGTPTAYKIYRDDSLLTTVAGLSYIDNAVVNGTSYGYYVVASYSGDDADPTDTVYATPNVISTFIIGEGTSSSGSEEGCPINVYYGSLHGQAVYTAAELNARGVFGPIDITELGFYVTGLPTKAMPNYLIRMKHTTAENVANWVDATNLLTVWTSLSYQPTQTGWNMLSLQTPFNWNGTDNLLVDTAFSLIGSWSSTGTVQYTSVTNGYRYVRSDSYDKTDAFTGGETSFSRPNIKLGISVGGGEVNPVSDLSITQVGATIVLSWTAVPGADWYNIYSSQDPYSGFTFLGIVTTAGASFPLSILPVNKAFLRVTTGTGPLPRGTILSVTPAN
ncbi:MAG: hypothetical protein CVU50_05940 [Candidatus Cloacimonetes bacterium HGW-Cloacimonetes-3]|jgi:subtilisin family serine protease|nr:MAG: hypothetical protein CVU50_05940 [Candidatus Cloacimonetes bacterium HGW-Cloacimonetes-3]